MPPPYLLLLQGENLVYFILRGNDKLELKLVYIIHKSKQEFEPNTSPSVRYIVPPFIHFCPCLQFWTTFNFILCVNFPKVYVFPLKHKVNNWCKMAETVRHVQSCVKLILIFKRVYCCIQWWQSIFKKQTEHNFIVNTQFPLHVYCFLQYLIFSFLWVTHCDDIVSPGGQRVKLRELDVMSIFSSIPCQTAKILGQMVLFWPYRPFSDK